MPKPPSRHWVDTLIYIVFCHIGWFVCVISAARGVGWLGVLLTLGALAYHLWRAQRPFEEAKLLVVAVLLGGIWESFLVWRGLLVYPNGIVIPSLAPYWILALWAQFAVQFNVLFVWLKNRLWLASVLGAIAGPLSFRGGAALGAVHFPNVPLALGTLALGWAVLFPALLALSRRWDGMRDITATELPA